MQKRPLSSPNLGTGLKESNSYVLGPNESERKQDLQVCQREICKTGEGRCTLHKWIQCRPDSD